VIRKFAPEERASIRAVTCDEAVALVVLDDERALSAAMAGLASADVPLAEVVSHGAVAMVVRLSSAPDWPAARKRLFELGADIDEAVARVSVVGDGLGTDHRTILGFREALGASAPLTLTVSPLRLSAVLPIDAARAAERSLHRQLSSAS
jgi:hypothetical protein